MINFGFKKKKDEPEGSSIYKVKCSKCGKQYQVPFKPDSSKPSYCSECLKKEKGVNLASFKGQPSRKSNKFKAVCAECGKDCELPFQPKKDKPVYCDECFKKRTGQKNRQLSGKDQYKEQLNLINTKLDKILNVLNRLSKNSNTTNVLPEVKSAVTSQEKKEVKAVSKSTMSQPMTEKSDIKSPAKNEKKTTSKVEKKKAKTTTKKEAKTPVKKRTATKKSTVKKSTIKKTTAAKKKK